MAALKYLLALTALLLVGKCQDEIEVRVPATIVIAPAQPEHTSGGRLTLTCAAYGEPLPIITWSLPSMGISNFSVLAEQSDSVDINTTVIDGRFVVSLLELCDVNYTSSWLLGGFVCEAANGVLDGGRPLGLSRVTLESLTPTAQIPAVLLVVPDGSYSYQGSQLVAECIAYGSPRPEITWSSRSLQIGDFGSVGATTNVITRDTELNGLIVTYSTLHICPSTLDSLSSYLIEIQCNATNGLPSPIGQQIGTFVPSPNIEILAFDVMVVGASPALTFTFSGNYDPEEHGCFLDKLVFLDGVINATVQFRPTYAGRCTRQLNNDMVIIAKLDPRDYLTAYNLLLFRNEMLFVATESSLLEQFSPPIQLQAIENDEALSVSNFIPNVRSPAVTSFDMDLVNSWLLIHFDSFVIASTFHPTIFTLQGTDVDPETRQRVTHALTTSLPLGILENVLTVCVRLSSIDKQMLVESQICTTRDNCAAYFTTDLADGIGGNSVLDNRSPTNPLRVSHFRRTQPNTVRGLYMNVTLSYIGCEVDVTLSEDEIYIARVGEFITRIDCYADGQLGNVNPELFYEGVLISNMVKDWPFHAYYPYRGGLAAERAGQYECLSTNGNKITHYLEVDDPYLRILEGQSIAVNLFDAISLTVLFAIQPPIDFQQSEIRLTDLATKSSPSFEPVVTVVNNFKATVVFDRARLSLSGTYNVEVRHDSVTVVQTLLRIIVNPPIVNIIPPVVTIRPEHDEIVLRCETNNAQLPIIWVANNLMTELSRIPEYRVSIPAQGGYPDLTRFTCIVRNPEDNNPNPSTIVGRADAFVRNVIMPVTILIDGAQALEDGQIRLANQLGVNLQCLGDAQGNHINVTWLAVSDGGTPQVVSANSEFFQVQYNYNEANLTVINSMQLFLGKLKCFSPVTGAGSSVTFVTSLNNIDACPGEVVDRAWNIRWDFTIVGSQDVQACPRIEGIQTIGFASRRCGAGGVWEDAVDTSACSTAIFNELRNSANELIQNKDILQEEELRTRLTTVMNMLSDITTPKEQTSHFPADLNTANLVTKNIISILRETIVEGVPLSLNTEMVKIFNNLLHSGNSEGWRQSQIRYNGSSMLLKNIELYGQYLAESLTSPVVDTTQYDVNGIVLTEPNIEYGVRTGRNEVNFPPSSSSFNPLSRIEISSAAIASQNVQAAINAVVNNLQSFLPQLVENNVTTQAITPVISSQLCSSSINCSTRTTFTGDNFATLFFTTTRTIGAVNPRCVFWDDQQGKWSTEGVVTHTQVTVEDREFKSYRLVCISRHLSSFAVIADVEVRELVFYTVPVFIGCGVVVFASIIALFALILSCLVDSIRKYFTVAFLTHLSFIFSMLVAYATYIVGTDLAVEERASCVAVAGLLHYFFTAAFAWLFCESLVITLFDWVAKRWWAFIFFFFIGWGLPAIPTAISLGVINDQYGTTSHCWFYFDGRFQSEIVLAFIIPKLVLILIIIVLQMSGCFRICSFMRTLMQKSLKKHTGRLLWCVWLSNLLFVLLLGSSWVFAMLYVNVYALDSVILGWVFMACSTALAVYIFIFSVSILVMNQKVDYEYMHQAHSGQSYVRDPMKGSTYEMINIPFAEGPVSRPRVIIPNPVFEDTYPSAYPNNLDDDDDDDMKLIEPDLGEDEESGGQEKEQEEEIDDEVEDEVQAESEDETSGDGDSDEDEEDDDDDDDDDD